MIDLTSSRVGKAMAMVLASAIAGLIGLSLGIANSREPSSDRSMLAIQAGSPLGMSVAITTSLDAITRTIEMLPTGHNYHSWTVRRVNRNTLASHWYLESWPGSADWMPNEPMWLVGALGTGLVLSDTIHMAGGIVRIDDSEPVEGAFCIWSGESGTLVSSGALKAGSPFTFAQLQAIVPVP